jgi:hypothetical protein
MDKNEDGWLNEGMAELAAHVNGFFIDRADDYVFHTDTQLTTLSHDPKEIAAHYANSFYFMAYSTRPVWRRSHPRPGAARGQWTGRG